MTHLRSSAYSGATHNRLLALTLGITLAGCSALQVDVDVYKGPLTSQREVQLRQFSTLALAAKPLLAELRNASELRKNRFAFKEVQDKDYMWRFFDREFEDDVARLANGALSYYEDLEPVGGLARARAAETANLQFQDALRRFAVDGERDCDLASRVARQVVPAPDQLADLRLAVADFLRAGTMDDSANRSVVCANGQRDQSYVTSSAALGKRRIENVRKALCPADGAACLLPESVSRAYLTLGDRRSGVATRIAQSTLTGDSKDAAELEYRLVEIGNSFQDARGAMRDLWATSHNLLEQAYRRLPKERARLTAKFIANTTEPRVLACFVNRFGSERGVDGNVRELVLQDIPQDWSAPLDRKRRANKFAKANEALESIANLYPIETSKTLDYINGRLKSLTDDETLILAGCPQYETAVDHRAELKFASKHYGLARGTAVENEFDRVLLGIVNGLAALTSPSRYGFDEGRARTGIVALTQTYVDLLARQQTSDVKAEVVEARRRLEETLIPFAERVLYVSNNAPLLNRDVDKDATLAQNVALLQAVGNTIIVLADDIRRQGDHDRVSESRRVSEAVAINRAFSGQSGSTYDALLIEITSTAKRLQADAARLNAQKARVAARADAAASQAQTGVDKVEAKRSALQPKAQLAEDAIKEAARFRAAIITVVAQKSTKGVSGVADDAKVTADQKAIAERVASLPPVSKPDAVVTAIKTWINEQIENDKPVGLQDTRGRRLGVAKQFFESPEVTFPNLKDAGTSKVFAELKARLVDWLGRREDAAKTLIANRAVAEAELKQAQLEVGDKPGMAEATRVQAKALEDAAAASNTSATDLGTALQAIKDVRETVLAKATGADAANPTNLMQLLAAELRTKADAAATGSDTAKRFTLAAAYVAKTSPAAVMSVEAEGGSRSMKATGATERTQVDVLDDLIAQLRQQRLQAIASGDGARAKNYEDALKAAFDQRGAMAYLRPTGSYLRNVYAATAIQADPDVGYTNMLAANLKRTLSSTAEGALARASVEKQFWQNINTVQVGAAGASNYVLVKDDIGNWYLKALSSDTNSIIQSAQSLALFNLGKKFDVNLLRKTELQRRVDSSESTPDIRSQALTELDTMSKVPGAGTGAATSGLTSVRNKYAQEYAAHTATDVGNLLSGVTKINTDLTDVWRRELKDSVMLPLLLPFVAGESDEQKAARLLLEAVAEKPAADQPVGGADGVVDALRSLRRMRDRLSTEVGRSDALIEPQVKAAKDAKDENESAQKAQAALKADAPTADVDEAKTRVTKAGEALSKAKSAMTEAKGNRTTAAAAVVGYFNQLMAATIGSRLDAIKAAETAYGFIGEAATAK